MHRPTPIHLCALAIITVLLSTTPASAQPPTRTPEQLDSISGLNAHHLCAGIFVVGRDYRRDPAKVLAEDIAPFPAFGWQDNFEYNVNWKNKSVTVSAPGARPRSASYHGDQGCTILPLEALPHGGPEVAASAGDQLLDGFEEPRSRVFFSATGEGGASGRRRMRWALSSTIHSTDSPLENSMAWARAEGKLMYHC